MKSRIALAAGVAAGLVCGTAVAQTWSPNPNKAQNSDMRTHSSTWVYPDGTTIAAAEVYPSVVPSLVWIVPMPSEQLAGTGNVSVAGMRNVNVSSSDTHYNYRVDRAVGY